MIIRSFRANIFLKSTPTMTPSPSPQKKPKQRDHLDKLRDHLGRLQGRESDVEGCWGFPHEIRNTEGNTQAQKRIMQPSLMSPGLTRTNNDRKANESPAHGVTNWGMLRGNPVLSAI